MQFPLSGLVLDHGQLTSQLGDFLFPLLASLTLFYELVEHLFKLLLFFVDICQNQLLLLLKAVDFIVQHKLEIL